MAPRIDLNLEQQPDDFEESGAQDTPVETVPPEQRPVTIPQSTTSESTTRGSADDDEGLIPFRTSKRLQGAIYRMIQQQDGKSQGNSTPVIKERTSTILQPSRKVKKQPESLHPVEIDVCKIEDRAEDTKTRPIVDIVKQVGCDIESKDVGSTSMRKRKVFTVHFAEPLFAYIDDEKEAARKLLSISSNDNFPRAGHVDDGEAEVKRATKKSTSHPYVNRQQQSIPPNSCFDLLCNHVGPRGWRCYRSSLEGKSFCRIHESRKTSSFESGFSQTLHI